MPLPEAGPSPRQNRAVRNDERIVDAAAAVLAKGGWARLVFGAVAAEAGLSVRPVRDRYPDRDDLAVAVWQARLAPVLSEAVGAVLAAAADAEDQQRLARVFRRFARPSGPLRAAGELLIVARYDATVEAAVTATLAPILGGRLTVASGGPSRVEAARDAFAVSLALGLLVESHRIGARRLDLDAEFRTIAAALRDPVPPRPLPDLTAPHLDEAVDFPTGDETWDALLRAMLDQVGHRGFDATTTKSVTRAAGCSEGFLFARYATKQDLFLDATRRMIAASTARNTDLAERVAATHGLGIAEAVLLREFMRPHRRSIRTVGLDQERLSWHDIGLRRAIRSEQQAVLDAMIERETAAAADDVRASLHVDLALGMGPLLLADLHPDAWMLPYDVVTVPRLQGRG